MDKFIRITIGSLGSLVYPVLRNFWGSVHHPYQTWRQVIREGNGVATGVVLMLFSAYFAIREPVRWGNLQMGGLNVEEISRPAIGLWGRIVVLRFGLSILTYLVMVVLITGVGWLVKKTSRPKVKQSFKNKLRTIFNVWIYSYLPTLLWFGIAAVAFVLLPPPRHGTANGWLFSVVFLAISWGLLAWKFLLYLLTLRLGLELTVKEIVIATGIIVPVMAVYSWRMYELGLFKVPFI